MNISDNNTWSMKYPEFNYQCPDCNGKFNVPAVKPVTSSIQDVYSCPFCGRALAGLSKI